MISKYNNRNFGEYNTSPALNQDINKENNRIALDFFKQASSFMNNQQNNQLMHNPPHNKSMIETLGSVAENVLKTGVNNTVESVAKGIETGIGYVGRGYDAYNEVETKRALASIGINLFTGNLVGAAGNAGDFIYHGLMRSDVNTVIDKGTQLIDKSIQMIGNVGEKIYTGVKSIFSDNNNNDNNDVYYDINEKPEHIKTIKTKLGWKDKIKRGWKRWGKSVAKTALTIGGIGLGIYAFSKTGQIPTDDFLNKYGVEEKKNDNDNAKNISIDDKIVNITKPKRLYVGNNFNSKVRKISIDDILIDFNDGYNRSLTKELKSSCIRKVKNCFGFDLII